MAHYKAWRLLPLLMLLVIFLALDAGFSRSDGVLAATGGYSISSYEGPNNRPAMAISPNSDKICTTWAIYGGAPDAYVRVYTIATESWNPPLSAPMLNLSQSPSENTQAVRCAIDTAGNIHVVWQEGSTGRIEYRRLPAGADPSSLANWTPKATISTPEASQWADLAASFSEGRVWMAYYGLANGTYNLFVQSWTPAAGWSAAEQLTTDGGQYPRIAVDNAGYVQIVYRGGGAIGYLYRDKDTGAWSAGGVELPGSDGAYEQTGLAVDRATGDVHVVYSGDPGSGRAVYYVRKIGPTGVAFTNPVPLTGLGGNYVVARIAWSPTGRLVMVADLRDSAGSLTFNTSLNNGVSWTGAGFFAEGTRAQWPWVIAGNGGTAYAVYWNNNDNNIYFTTLGLGDTPPGPPPPAPTPTPTPRSSTATPTPMPRSPTPTPTPTAVPGSAFSEWSSLGGVLTDSPAAAEFNGRVYAFARGSDDALYLRSSADGAGYSTWQTLGGILSGTPAAASVDGRLYVFVRGSDDALYLRSSADGVTFDEWQTLGGILSDPPAAAAVNGRLYVFAKGSDNALYARVATDGVTFGEWQGLGGALAAAPAATGYQGQISVFVKGSDNALYLRRSTGPSSFGDWQLLGGNLAAAPAAASYTPAGGRPTLYVFANGSDNTLYERHSTDGRSYTDWTNLGGQLYAGSSPAAAGVGGRLYVFVQWSDRALYGRYNPR